MSLRKDPTLYTAVLRNLKLFAWGIDQVVRETFQVTVYQVTCRPQKWAARPVMSHNIHRWEGPSAEAVMQLVTADFEEMVTQWAVMPTPQPASPTLRSGADVAGDRRRA
jgi:hypothetical protein